MSSFLPIRVQLAPSSTRKVPKLLGDTVKRLVAVCEHRGLVHPYPPSYDGSGSSTALPPLPRHPAADSSEDGGENEARGESGEGSSVGDGGENEAAGESEAGEENEAGQESEAGSGESEVDAGESEAGGDSSEVEDAVVVGQRAGTRAGTRAKEQRKRGRG